jgi:hypothetical protein
VLSDLTSSSERLALVGLAKNTGKTEALAALLRELSAAGRTVGVTSVGRDGEEHDVIDFRIDKPRVLLGAGSLVATTDALLSASGLPHQLLEQTDVRTPLGRVLIARLRGPGAIEVAGPSAATQVRAVSDAMLGHGAEQVLIDGAIDRRAASSPAVADGLVMSTGAVLSAELEEVVTITNDAVELVRLPAVERDGERGERLRELAAAGISALVGEDYVAAPLPPRFVLASDAAQVEQLLEHNSAARWLIVSGALPEQFLRVLAQTLRKRSRELTVIVADATRVFLGARGVEWYRRQGLEIEVLSEIELLALTVNPVAPQSHTFDSAQMRALLRERIPDVPTFDVMHPEYLGEQGLRPRMGARSAR